MTSLQKPKVLVLGVSGQIGRFVLEHLDKYPQVLNVRITARRPEQVSALQQQGRDAVLLDLDDPTTFAAALHGVDRVLLLTGYTVAFLAASTKVLLWASIATVYPVSSRTRSTP